MNRSKSSCGMLSVNVGGMGWMLLGMYEVCRSFRFVRLNSLFRNRSISLLGVTLNNMGLTRLAWKSEYYMPDILGIMVLMTSPSSRL